MAQTEHRGKDEKNLQVKIEKGDAKFKLSGGLKEEYHSTNSERCDIAAAHSFERRGQRADVSQGAAIGFFSGGFAGGGVGAGVGAVIGAVVGTIVPGPGNVVGAAVGAAIGGVVGAAATGGVGLGVGAAVSSKIHRSKKN